MLCIAKEAPDASHLPNEPIPTAPLVGADDPVRPPPSIFCRTSGRVCRGRCRAQLFATKERYRCGLPLAGTHRPASAILHRAIVFECRGGRLCPPAKAPSASEEACCIPFPPGRRKLHIRSLLLPSQIVTVSLGHNLAVGNFTTPHAILMMALRQHLRIRFVRAAYPIYAKKRRQMASLFCLH